MQGQPTSSPAVVILEVVNAPLCKGARVLHLMTPAGRVALACLVASIAVDAQLQATAAATTKQKQGGSDVPYLSP
jgi:hypothetical protein